MDRKFAGGIALLLCVVLAGIDANGQTGQKPATTSLVPLTDDQKIEQSLSEMLAAWQIGDVELLHKYYADDVTVVSGLYEAPVIGWANYANAYRAQRQRIQQVRLDRRNTYIFVRGNVAWACYQWEFSALVDGQPSSARGQATLILEKRGGNWLIVHNHTSMVGAMQTVGSEPPPAPPKPGTQGNPPK
jgi:ketosteroid isomerase-like protein